jgi:hypothetical protein
VHGIVGSLLDALLSLGIILLELREKLFRPGSLCSSMGGVIDAEFAKHLLVRDHKCGTQSSQREDV